MQYPRSDSNHHNENDNCEALAPFVMSLFDGEADEFEAKQARAHLLICQTCAHRWLDWNRSRDLLRSMPVPAPPPTLLWRVLMACRLASFTSKAPAKTSQSSTNFNGAPNDLSAQILARTTRTAVPVGHSVSTVKKSRFMAMPALAVPAMALWLLVLQRDTFIATLPLDSSLSTETELVAPPPAPRRAPQRSVAVLQPRNRPAKAPLQPRLVRVAPAPLEAPSENIERESVEREAPVRRIAEPRRVEWTPPTVENRERAPRFEPVVVSPPTTRERSTARVSLASMVKEPAATVAVQPQAGKPKVVRLALAAPTRPRISRLTLRPATLSDDEATPRLRAARWKRVASSTPHTLSVSAPAPVQVLRVSFPSSPAPAAPPVRLLAENFEGDDGRVDEMRSVVDDFRATLAPDDSTAETEEDSGRS